MPAALPSSSEDAPDRIDSFDGDREERTFGSSSGDRDLNDLLGLGLRAVLLTPLGGDFGTESLRLDAELERDAEDLERLFERDLCDDASSFEFDDDEEVDADESGLDS